MDEIVVIEGDELDYLLTQLAWLGSERTTIRIRVTIDEGAFKFKVNERTWSRPIGHLEPNVEALRRMLGNERPAGGVGTESAPAS